MTKTVVPVLTGNDGPWLEPRTALIRVSYWDKRVEERTLNVGKYIVGREHGDVICFGDRSVSRNHAQIEIQPGQVVVTDLGSTNGTFDQRGHRIAVPTNVAQGHSVHFGQNSITVLKVLPLATSGVMSTSATLPAIPAVMPRDSATDLGRAPAESEAEAAAAQNKAPAPRPVMDTLTSAELDSRPAPPHSGPVGKR